MRAALILLAVLGAAPAAAGVPLVLGERQVVTLEFDRPIARVATTDPDLVSAQTTGPRLRLTALRAGRASLDVVFADGAAVTYDLAVEGTRRTAAAGAPAPVPGVNELALRVAEVRRFVSPGVSRVMIEENGVARVSVEGETVSVVALAPGEASLVLQDRTGGRRTWQIRVR